MESWLPGTNGPGAGETKQGKTFMACIRCRDRKISCDGKSPECSTCTSSGLRCQYRAIRKMRGPGKKKKALGNQGAPFQETESLGAGERHPPHADDFSKATHESREKHEDSKSLETRLRQLYPVFLHPENTTRVLQDLKRAGQGDQKSSQGFAPLPPKDIVHYALENTYSDITALCPIFDLATVQQLNAEQQAINTIHPAGNPARWAILSTWIALAMRLRMAPGSEDELKSVIDAYYRNAKLVLSDLILRPATMESVQALLLMGALADEMEDHRAFVMFVTNALRQIELLSRSSLVVMDRAEREALVRLLGFAKLQDGRVARKYGVSMILNSTSA